jgi:hypothetical protein
MTNDNDRDEYITGLRQLADILERHDDLPLPYTGTASRLLWIAGLSEDHAELARTFARNIPGVLRKNVRGDVFDLIGDIQGLHVQLIVDRDAVCERVVTGTETVTRQVPDPSVVVPTVEVTEVVEQVEWVCSPLLADREPAEQVSA